MATCIKSFIFYLLRCSLKQELVKKLLIPVRNTFIPKSCACQETCPVPLSLRKLLYRHARSWEHPQEGGATCTYSPARRSQRGSWVQEATDQESICFLKTLLPTPRSQEPPHSLTLLQLTIQIHRDFKIPTNKSRHIFFSAGSHTSKLFLISQNSKTVT